MMALSIGCARHSGLYAGEVKNIHATKASSPLLKPGEPGSPVVEVENVTVPGMKETPPSLDYIVGPNDSILVVVTNAPEYSTAVMAMVPTGTSISTLAGGSQLRGGRVDGNGEIQMPMLGQVKVGGMTVPQIRIHIEKLLKQYMKEPSVTVEVVDYGSSPLYLLGQFKATGVFYMDRPYNVLQGIARGGGYDSASANPRSARIIRDNRVLPVDVFELLMRADQSQNIWLKPGDTIFMPDNRDQRVFVFGAGKTGMIIPLTPQGMNLLQAIAAAGLQEIGYHSQNVHLIRSLSPTKGQLMVVDVDAIIEGNAMPLQLCDGDVIYIPKDGMTSWNETIGEILPTLQAFGAILEPFVQLRYLKNN
jgi:polysaccharide export outer membrane protein